MEAESPMKLLLTQIRHIGGSAVITCIGKEYYYLFTTLAITHHRELQSSEHPGETSSEVLFPPNPKQGSFQNATCYQLWLIHEPMSVYPEHGKTGSK